MKQIAEAHDLRDHIRKEPTAVHGIWSMFKSWAATNILKVWKHGTGYIEKPLIQYGTVTGAAAPGTLVTFGTPFKTGTTPAVFVNSTVSGGVWGNAISITNLVFYAVSYDHTGAAQAAACHWVAIGEAP